MVSVRNSREDVVAAAGRLFAERGYHGTSMRDLGRELGLLGSSLYAHVASKQDLLVEVVEQGSALFQASARAAVAAGGSPVEQLGNLIRGHVDVILGHLEVARTFLNEARMLDEEHRSRVIAARDDYEAVFRRVLQDGIDSGAFRAGLDAKTSSIFLLSILNAVERWYRPGERLDRDGLVGELTEFSMRGLG